MPNKYCNLTGTNQIKDEFGMIPAGFALVETDINRASGFNSHKEEWYNHNIIPFSDCEASDGWANGSWVGDAGTVASDSTAGHFKTGNQGIAITADASSRGGHLQCVKNFALFTDGSASALSDFIRIWVYITTAEINKMAADSALQILFHCDAKPTANNFFTYTILKASLVNGGSFFNIAKSAFSTSGAPNWADIKGITMRYVGSAPTSAVTWTIDTIHVCRKDSVGNYPNPFQRRINNAETVDFNINSGFWWLGLENGKLNWRNLNPLLSGLEATASSLVGVKSYKDFVIYQKSVFKTVNRSVRLAWEIDASNRILVLQYDGNLFLYKTVAGAISELSHIALTTAVGDALEIILRGNGITYTVLAFKNGDRNIPYSLSGMYDFTASVGYLAVPQGADVYGDIESLSITTTEHAAHADVAEVAKSLTNNWQSWIPTLTWVTATPSGLTVKARYVIIGNTCFYELSIVATNGNGATALAIDLPIAPKNTDIKAPQKAYQYVGSTLNVPIVHISPTGNLWVVNFATATAGQTFEMHVGGAYEIA